MKEVLEAIPPETTTVVVVDNKYWTNVWRDYTSFYVAKDLVLAKSVYITRALSTSIQLEGLVKDPRANNFDFVQRLETSLHYGDAISVERAKAEDAKINRAEVESNLDKVKAVAKQLKKELHETERQVVALMRRVDYANERHHLAVEALESSNKEKAELRRLTKSQVEEIGSLKAEAKAIGKTKIQNFIDNFKKTELCDTFTNYWTSRNAQLTLERLRELNLDLDM